MVYASSAAVYGDAVPQIAEEAPKRPLSAYGADKYACELHAGVASHVHGLADDRATVLQRLRTTPGPQITLRWGDLDLLRSAPPRAAH